ncbi:uncharacterized protein G2W53_039175 [Senna tora]|uniref:Uncharacterized protein n=1 Tax=Senna tora TaxID=362788 RepID=A0A834T0X4_9FABA|nr:uncharacterized protein G2W53_039175 [Senna tora]
MVGATDISGIGKEPKTILKTSCREEKVPLDNVQPW